MKKLLTLALFLFIVGSSYSQKYVFQPLDNSVASSFWQAELFKNNYADAKMDLTDHTADKKEGTGSLKIDYSVGGESWGGYVVRATPRLPDYINISTGTNLTFWYKVTTPVVTTQAGITFMDFKIGDFDAENKRDLWYREILVDFADASGQWKQVTVDLTTFKDGGDKTKEWALQYSDGDREIQLDKVKSFEIAVVYLTTGSASAPTANGTILLDGFAVTGDRYTPPIISFVNQASQFSKDIMEWAGAGNTSSVTLTNEATDKVEGTTGSLKIDYTAYASQDWGGYVSINVPVTAPAKFVERTYLSFYAKNVTAVTSTVPKRAMLRITITEESTPGQAENWMTKVPIDLTKISDWTRYDLPLKEIKLIDGDQHPATGGWGQNGTSGNKVFNPDKMTKISFDFFAIGAGADAGPKGEKLIGTLLLGVMQQSGYQIFDIVAPLAPTVNVVAGIYSNLITWTDLAGETTEKYSVYTSKSPITNVNAKGVEVVASGIPRGTQVIEHLLRSPKTDRTYVDYYAVNAIDKAGNVGAVTSTGAIGNTAKGIPTIPILTVPNWKADGSLTEWAGVTPFRLRPSDGSAHIMTGFTVTNDADVSADMYLAMDQQYLYFAASVTDDIVFNDISYLSKGSSWALDAVDLEIGLYNQEAKQHTSYKHGKVPDYHFRFNKDRARSDHWESEKDSLLLPGDNYKWADKFPSGYVVEARLKISDIAALRNTPKGTKDSIYVKEGYKIPLQLVVNDNDGLNSAELWRNREGQIGWSPFDNDAGWRDPSTWMYTWLGNTDVISTDVNDELPLQYSLDQNYPNPFNPATQIKYSIAKAGIVTLKVYDILGRQVTDLVNKYQEAGKYTVDFNASRLASGVYIYRIESSSFTDVKKMMLIK
ncbi:MAG: T9SS type A sorting domain-containing protein [Melioribacteraceae bacterium]